MDGGSSRLSATLHVTHKCNLRCSYCYTGEKSGAGMTASTADGTVAFLLEECKKTGAGDLELVFFGGEPLRRTDLIYRILDRVQAHAGDISISAKLSTNGMLLTDEMMGQLSRRQVFVSISVDGDPEVHDLHRQDALGVGTAAQLEAGITTLLRWNPCANVSMVITPETADRVDRSVQWLIERGFSYITPTLDFGSDWSSADLGHLESAYERLADWYVAETLEGRSFYLSTFDERIRTHAQGPPGCEERCSFGQRQISIAPSGRIYPCVQFVGEDDDLEFVIGHVDTGFDEERRHVLQTAASGDKPECSGCTLQSRCTSWCACVNWQSTGQIDRAGPLVCAHERTLIPIADRIATRLWKRRNPLFLHKHYNPIFPVLSFVENLVIQEEMHV